MPWIIDRSPLGINRLGVSVLAGGFTFYLHKGIGKYVLKDWNGAIYEFNKEVVEAMTDEDFKVFVLGLPILLCTKSIESEVLNHGFH